MKRVATEVPDELFEDVLRYIPWGVRQRLMLCVIEQVVEVAKEHGELGIAAILCGKLTLVEVLSHGYVGKSPPLHLNTGGVDGDARGSSDQTKSQNPKEAQASACQSGQPAKPKEGGGQETK
jgi:hypothetical protein